MEIVDFKSALRKAINVGRDISTLITGSRERQPYWCRCLGLFAMNVNNTVATVYQIEMTPEEEQFLELKESFRELYELNRDDIDKGLIIEVEDENGNIRKIPNDKWLRIEGGAHYEDEIPDDDLSQEKGHEISSSEIHSGNRCNRGISIVISKAETSKHFDCELPISEMFEAALLLRRNGFKKPHHPYCVIYVTLKCIIHSGVNYNPILDEICDGIEQYVTKDGTSIDKKMNAAKAKLRPLLKKKGGMISGLASQLENNIDEVSAEDLWSISQTAQSKMNAIGETGNVGEIFSDLMPTISNGDINKKMEEFGLGGLQETIDRIGSGGMSNDDLLSSIPTGGDMDLAELLRGSGNSGKKKVKGGRGK